MANPTPLAAVPAKIPLRGALVAALKGGSGKSIVAVGLAAAFRAQGRQVVPFKKGPDYIDAGWLGLAAAHPCYNLDPFLMETNALLTSFHRHARQAELALIEGNRGLFDGVTLTGTYSSAELARLLGVPVLLVVDCTKATRTVAAMVLGCRHMDQDLVIQGVILNQIARPRHEKVVREAVEYFTGLPVLGAVPRQDEDAVPMRHLGLTPTPEHGAAGQVVSQLAALMASSCDLERIWAGMPAVASAMPAAPAAAPPVVGRRVRIGVVRDAAFQFYYPENLEALAAQGAILVPISALADQALPELDALYIGGGFPETQAATLAANVSFRDSFRQAALAGLPVYAECGGLMYLGQSLTVSGETFPMAGVLPVRFTLQRRPQAHGYTEMVVDEPNPFYPVGTRIRGHEFRYSQVMDWQGSPEMLACRVERGVGFVDGRDGVMQGNVLALYTHVHSIGLPGWAGWIVARARDWRG
ncbi:MAG: cobyrinate a,c-diamide synthase [Thermodesulfobacteriota bacterium]